MKKGFTLIELLAVIVILAIIALIAVPIILNIIGDARDSANKRSVELYGKAIENTIAKSRLNGEEVAAGDLTTAFLNTVKYSGSRVSCTTNKLYSDGSIYLAGCTVGTEQEVLPNITVTKATAQTKTTGNVPAGEYAAGDEYIINIGGENRIFFVLGENESDTSKVDLIMNQNIGNTVAWCSDATQCKTNGNWDNTKGPITANAYLTSQTSNCEVTPYIPTLDQLDDAYTGVMPAWIIDYMEDGTSQSHVVSGLYGYWTSSPNSDYSNFSFTMCGDATVGWNSINDGVYYGVRPAITISKSLLD